MSELRRLAEELCDAIDESESGEERIKLRLPERLRAAYRRVRDAVEREDALVIERQRLAQKAAVKATKETWLFARAYLAIALPVDHRFRHLELGGDDARSIVKHAIASSCKHRLRHAGPNVPRRWGHAPTEVCSICGAWREVMPGKRYRWRQADRLQEYLQADDEV